MAKLYEEGKPITAAKRPGVEVAEKKAGRAEPARMEVAETKGPGARKVASKGSWTLPPSVTKHPK